MCYSLQASPINIYQYNNEEAALVVFITSS